MDDLCLNYRKLMKTVSEGDTSRSRDCLLVALQAGFVLLLDTHVPAPGRMGLSDSQSKQVVQIFRENLSRARKLAAEKVKKVSRR